MRVVTSVILGALTMTLLIGAVASQNGEVTGRYRFLPARQHLWVVDEEKGELLFFKFPDTETRPIQRSKTIAIDRSRFPRGKSDYLISTREMSSILWIVNETTGEVQVVGRRRDGTFSAEFQLSAAQQFQ